MHTIFPSSRRKPGSSSCSEKVALYSLRSDPGFRGDGGAFEMRALFSPVSERMHTHRRSGILDRHREGEADEEALLHGIEDGGNDAEYFAFHIDQWAA